ncbi:MAG: hypothetical protein BRD42_00120 [Bacteroidetes bacterium QS_3_64_15]|nr:MAG: hypothetical protein BRD42_00120 [Bacteroidetes bacterium QS_3_64_15]
MADAFSDPNEPFSDASSSVAGPDAPPWEAAEDDPLADDSLPSFALDMARLWVQRHRKVSMLGSFAIGVFVGVMLRE